MWYSVSANVVEVVRNLKTHSSHACLNLAYQNFVKCMLSNREYNYK